ncbi:monooxygenase [Actinoallomurus sp. CA-150999]|uniref:monooxygenase n=1 Tax=Actinoallomurus sp. CA-150999 TaxID=3239887 RepID=UPI003D918361
MTKQITRLRILALVAGAMTLVAAACGSNETGSGSATTADGGGRHTSPMHMPSSVAQALPLRAGERFVNLTAPQPYTPSAPNGGTDEYRCLVIDPHLTKPVYLTGTQFEPGNPSIVHHAITYAIPPESAAEARAKDAATPGQGWTCFGGDGLRQGGAWVDTWTPNHRETLLKQDVGFPLKPGSLLILQVHYNLLATGGRAGASDQPRVRLRLTDGTAATKPLAMVPLEAPIELPCAGGESGPLCDRAAAIADVAKRFGVGPGSREARLVSRCSKGKPVPGNTQHCDYPVPQPMTVYAGLGHMHLLGRSIKVELDPGTPKARTLLDVPSFDFDDQKLTPLPTPVDVKPGDTVRVTCTHDATLRRKLPELSKLPPRYVVWGDGTSDEMCLGLLSVTGPGGKSLG